MLNKLRNSSKNQFVKITLGSLLTVLMLSFALWGTEDLIGVSNKKGSVATVGNIEISNKEFLSLYNRQTEEIRKLLGASMNIERGKEFGYVDRALSSLVNRALFNNEAMQLGLSVSDKNVRDKIIKDEAFKDGVGQFSELLFRQLISESGYSEEEFVEGTRQDLAREQMVDTIRSSLILPNIIKKNIGDYNTQERTVNYISLKSENQKINKIKESEAREFFQKNLKLFLTDEYRKVETLLLDANEYANNIVITNEEIKLIYEERKDDLIKPERRYLKQILLNEKSEADKIRKKINLKNFTSIASMELNLDEDDIDLGWNTKDELPDGIVDEVFKLKKNNISKPIQSIFGWHIILLIDVEDREELSFENVKKTIKKELLLEKGKEAVYDLQDDLEDLLASGDSLKEISEKLELTLLTAKAINNNGFNQDGSKNNSFQDERILRAVFNQKENEEGNLIDIDKDEGLAISIVNQIIPSRQMSFEEAKTLVYEEVEKENKFLKAIERSNEIKDKIEKNKSDLVKISNELGIEVRGIPPFNRIKPDDSQIPLPMISKIFDSKLNDLTIHNNGKEEVLIAQLIKITNQSNLEDQEINKFYSRIEEDMSIDLLAQFSEVLRKKYKISINDDVIDSLN